MDTPKDIRQGFYSPETAYRMGYDDAKLDTQIRQIAALAGVEVVRNVPDGFCPKCHLTAHPLNDHRACGWQKWEESAEAKYWHDWDVKNG